MGRRIIIVFSLRTLGAEEATGFPNLDGLAMELPERTWLSNNQSVPASKWLKRMAEERDFKENA